MKEIGAKGQNKFLNGKVLIIGAGEIGAMGGVIGSLQAMEAVKYLTGQGALLTGKLLTYDALKMEFRTIKLPKDKHCAVCVEGLPNESCGLLAGDIEGETKIVKEVYLLTNMDDNNEHFSMDTKEQLVVVKDARKKGYEMIGNFHSHSESPSRPSEEDKRLAYDSKAEYLVLSLVELKKPIFKAFGIDADKNVTIHEIQIS